MRIGHGYDVHRLVPDRKLILGGVLIPHETGLLGHSDADVLTHAVMDALLGAAAMGDIGKLFPDNDEAFRGADSLLLAREVAKRLQENGWRIGRALARVPEGAEGAGLILSIRQTPEMKCNFDNVSIYRLDDLNR